MDIVTTLATLAHDGRLSVFRLLMRRYPQAVPAGDVARALDLKQNTCSQYLKALTTAGLLDPTREGTSIRYSIAMPAARDLMTGIMGTCCRNRPDLCLPDVLPESWNAERSLKMADTPLNVLFVCTSNSARSILAESIMNHEGNGKFRAFSAGMHSKGAPHPKVIELLQSKGIPTETLRSKPTSEFEGPDAPKLDFLFTVCDHAANEECPLWPGQPMTAHWGLPDPTRVEGTDAQRELAFQQTYGLLRNRITAFLALPFATLDAMSLQHRLDDIGATENA